MHLIVWLDRDTHFTPSELDKIICAEIPDKHLKDGTENPMYKIVTNFMLHGPCGPGWKCYGDGRCRIGFPKPFQEETAMLDDA